MKTDFRLRKCCENSLLEANDLNICSTRAWLGVGDGVGVGVGVGAGAGVGIVVVVVVVVVVACVFYLPGAMLIAAPQQQGQGRQGRGLVCFCSRSFICLCCSLGGG